MGAFYFSIDPGLIEVLLTRLPLESFVETGTFEGESIRAAKPYFKKLYTIELSKEYHRSASLKFQDDPTVDVILGSSPEELVKLSPTLKNESAIYWLDAHWCMTPQRTENAKSQCPLLGELDALNPLNEKSAVLIDDARLFLSVPPSPHEADDWPDFDAIIRKLFSIGKNHMVTVVNDVIAYVPRNAFPALRDYARDHSVDLLVELDKARHFDALKEEQVGLLEKIDRLSALLDQSETDRAARLTLLEKQDALLKEQEQRLSSKAEDLAVLKEGRHELLQNIDHLSALLDQSEADRAARLALLEKQDSLLKENEHRLNVSESDRAARLVVIENQQQALKEMEARLNEAQSQLPGSQCAMEVENN